jgi:hypothetical protein
MRALLGLLLLATAIVAPARAATITFPLVVDHPILEAALRRDLGMTDDRSLELWGTPGDCHWAVIDELSLDADGARLRVSATGSTVAGFRLLWFCVSPFAWQGSLVLTTRPVVGRDWQLRFDSLDVEAHDLDGQPSPLTNGALQLVKGRLEERLHEFHFDLAPPAVEAKALIRAAAEGEQAARVVAALDSLRPLDTSVDADGVRVIVAMDVPDAAREPSPSQEPPLSEAEVKTWEDRLDRWEAFVVFAVKLLASSVHDRAVRSELLAILLDARRELVVVLQQGPVPGTDPVRNLFLSTWDRLRVQTRRALHGGAFGDRAERFVTFLAAGDALAALDQAGPGLGLEISADGLRRLARLVDPDERADPIPVSDAVDSELQALFGFREPGPDDVQQRPPARGRGAGAGSTTAVPPSTIAPPSATTAPPAAVAPPSTLAPPATTAPPAVDAPPTTGAPPSTDAPPTTIPPAADAPATDPPATDEPATGPPTPPSAVPLSWLFAPRSADAATVDLAVVGKRLDRWVPADDELATYRTTVETLLTTVADHRVDRLDDRLRPIYRNLVPAVAWQESCWRQFVLKNGRVAYLRSATGDVGIMQVNLRVWRGFFDVVKLEWDAVYNAASGAEILVQLLSRVGPKESTRSADDAARAAYSAYNAGPGAYARYRTAKAKSLGRAIDDGFYEKYRRVATGSAGDDVLCMGQAIAASEGRQYDERPPSCRVRGTCGASWSSLCSSCRALSPPTA